jgi:S1-C subfamily serine protease
MLLLATCLIAGCDNAPSSVNAATQKIAAEFADVRRDAAVVAVERAMPSVVNIRTTQLVRRNDAYDTIFRRFYGLPETSQVEERPSDVGSGVIIDEIGEDGYILTNVHVVERANRVQMQLWDGREYDAQPLLATSQKDLALYRITRRPGDKPFKPITIAKDDDLLLGETVLAVGNPFGLGGSIARGILSSKNRRADSGGQKLNYADWLQTDADINPGNSGGPLINLNGELIGINVAVVGQNEGKGTGFAIPAKQISAALSDFFSLEWTAKLWLGARLRGAPYPLTVREVQTNSPAFRAGLRVGQQVLEVNGKTVKGLGDFNLYMNQKADHHAEIIVLEAGKKKSLTVEMIRMEDLQRQMIFSRLGLRTQRLTAEQAKVFELSEKNVLVVTEVDKGSPAESANLKPGMVVLDVDGENFSDQITATNILGNKKSGERVTVRLKVPNRLAHGFVEARIAQIELPVR